ncbi:DUF5683 domain-containing protein [Botryobacter ruber]|uniref:DUF5683 domain-containing protein n=1 Tax=Botryobacter ruber TaxID=2171629 RepID=UPI000E0C58CA|nr:DUF5683 domain-containing protein [Botryobacter ruber]
MKLRTGFAVLAAGFLVLVTGTTASAQVITTGPDSVVVTTTPTPEPRQTGFLKTWDKPAKAALFSAVVPGLGQVYNGAWWKVPIVYATGGVLGYYWIDNSNKYQSYRQALLIRLDTIPNTVDEYADHLYLGTNYPNGTANLRRYRDYYRRNRDLTILLSILAWGMQVAEAHIHAHLKDFDVSDDLALRIEPNMIRMPATTTYTPALTVTLYTKAK